MKLVILKNDLVGAESVEPFAGGASVALSLLFEEFVSRVYINDLNPGVFTFSKAVGWSNLMSYATVFCGPGLTMREWRGQHDIKNRSATETVDDLDLALATFVLNRTNRSGIIDGGPIGGHNQTGGWKVDARYNAEELAKRVRKVARFADRISVSGADAERSMTGSSRATPPGARV
jgi:DNA adenine methylase